MTRDSDPDLAELTETEEQRLAAALRSAFAPGQIDPERHERLLRAALDDPFAPPSPDELVESERLRRALDGEAEGDHLDLVLARALSAAHSPQAAPEASLAQAARGLEARAAKVLYLRFGGVIASLAVAAGVVLTFGSRAVRAPAPAPDLQTLTLAQSRSTAPLFPSALAAGPPSTRIDRIASVRARELRENRYALWGLR